MNFSFAKLANFTEEEYNPQAPLPKVENGKWHDDYDDDAGGYGYHSHDASHGEYRIVDNGEVHYKPHSTGEIETIGRYFPENKPLSAHFREAEKKDAYNVANNHHMSIVGGNTPKHKFTNRITKGFDPSSN